MPSLSCYKLSFLGSSRFDYVDKMMVSTILPLLVVVLLYLLYAVHMAVAGAKPSGAGVTNRRGEHRVVPHSEEPSRPYTATEDEEAMTHNRSIRSAYITLFLLLTYMVLPGVSTTLAGAVPCIDIDPDKVQSTYPRYYLKYVDSYSSPLGYEHQQSGSEYLLFLHEIPTRIDMGWSLRSAVPTGYSCT